MKTIIVAEVGECFNGDMETAKKLIRVAKDTGCDYVKFQTLDYESISDDDPESDWFKKVALNPEKIAILIGYAEVTDIKILFTPENIKTAKWLKDLEQNEVKIASNLATDSELISFINGNFKRVIMSTGMASLDGINDVIRLLDNIEEVIILHCISEYPTGHLLEKRGLVALRHENVRFNMMKILMGLFPNHKVGYSDHTDDILAPIVAVAMGAKVIEKHITLDRETPINNFLNKLDYLGTDHVLSVEPDKLKEMVEKIREVEKMFGAWKWERTEGEEILKEFLKTRFTSEN